MKKLNKFYLKAYYMLLCVAIVPTLSLSLLSCEPEPEMGEGDGNSDKFLKPAECWCPYGSTDYFMKGLHFFCSPSEAHVDFRIDVDYSVKVVSADGGSVSWCSIAPVSGKASEFTTQTLTVRVSANNSNEARSAKIRWLNGTSKVAEITVTQEKKPKIEAVDLGLSVKWANCNVGAESPEDYGGSFAWGETEEKNKYSWSSYKWCKGYGYNGFLMTKYCHHDVYGIVDNKSTLDPEDDIAHLRCGDGWRMPTADEVDELCEKCSWSWKTTQNGVRGIEVTGPNGNSIFFTLSGYIFDGARSADGTLGYYWSSTLSTSSDPRLTSESYACCLKIDPYEKTFREGIQERHCGLPIRPVKGK